MIKTFYHLVILVVTVSLGAQQVIAGDSLVLVNSIADRSTLVGF